MGSDEFDDEGAVEHLRELVRIGNIRWDDHGQLLLCPAASTTSEDDLVAAGLALDHALTTLGLEREWKSQWSHYPAPGERGFRGVEFILSGPHLATALKLLPEIEPPAVVRAQLSKTNSEQE